MEGENTSDPFIHARAMQRRLDDLISHARDDISRITEPRMQALLETSAEVLRGLKVAYEHYEQQTEQAWRISGR